MALFGDKKKTGKKSDKAKKPAHYARAKKPLDGKEHDIIRAPWFSEKALLITDKGIYVFEVPRTATKADIAGAIKSLYGVSPKSVRIVNLPAKVKSLRTRRGVGVRSARRKAYVYLNAGDTIQLA